MSENYVCPQCGVWARTGEHFCSFAAMARHKVEVVSGGPLPNTSRTVVNNLAASTGDTPGEPPRTHDVFGDTAPPYGCIPDSRAPVSSSTPPTQDQFRRLLATYGEAAHQVGELCVTKEPATDAMWKRHEAREAAYKAYASLENQLAEVTAERDAARQGSSDRLKEIKSLNARIAKYEKVVEVVDRWANHPETWTSDGEVARALREVKQ
jgi:hypothetical protein